MVDCKQAKSKFPESSPVLLRNLLGENSFFSRDDCIKKAIIFLSDQKFNTDKENEVVEVWFQRRSLLGMRIVVSTEPTHITVSH
jgi:hypothetical protein